MQDITTKLARIAAVTKAAGLSADQARHLIHGTGGSPRRAKRAILLGIHTALIDAYGAVLAESGAHATAVVACNKLWADLVPSPAADADDEAQDAAAAHITLIGDEGHAEAQAQAIQAIKRVRRQGVMPSMMPSPADLKALLPATV